MLLEPAKLWDGIKKELISNDIKLSQDIETEVRAVSFEEDEDTKIKSLYIEIDSKSTYQELDYIKETIEKITNDKYANILGEIKLDYIKRFSEKELSIYDDIEKKEKFITNLNDIYRLDNYIVGDNNNMAYNIALTILNGETKYSPLLIYGDVGLGKTHLAQAIGNEYLKRNKDFKILYIASTEFANELLASFKEKTTISFKDKFRALDMLIVDDIQFFEKFFGKGDDIIQKEFFDVFNILYQKNKPLVFISDRSPDEIKNVDERLTSRLKSGTSSELKLPDKSVRIATIKEEAQKENLDLTLDLITYIADELETNFREILGFMKNISARVSLIPGTVLNKELIDLELNKRIKKKKDKITSDKIIEIVCEYYEISKEEVIGKGRTKKTVMARDSARYLLSTHLDINLGEIGRIFNTDHSTIVKAIKKIEQLDPKDELKEDIKKLTKKIQVN